MTGTGPAACEQSVLVATVVDGIPLDALAARLTVRRGTIYKTDFNVRHNSERAHPIPTSRR